MLKKLLLYSSICIVYITLIAFQYNNHKRGVHTIVLDAGHGGKDGGAPCVSGTCNEADITLAIVLKLGKKIEQLLPDTKVYYTRKDDSYPSLHYRAEFANDRNADLFISIHCNSRDPYYKTEPDGYKTVTYSVGKGKKKKTLTKEIQQYKRVKYNSNAKGLETYIWTPNKNEQKTDAIAALENAEIYKDPEYKTKYGGGVDINSTEFIAKAKLRTKKYFVRSTMLATHVQTEGSLAGRTDGNIRQRGIGIWVLQATAMPSILVETGYVSNPEEERYLNSAAGQAEMADIIARAIKKYDAELQNKNIPNTPEKSVTITKHYEYTLPKQYTSHMMPVQYTS